MKSTLLFIKFAIVFLGLSYFSYQLFAQEDENKTAPVELVDSEESVSAPSCEEKSWTISAYAWGPCGPCWAKSPKKYRHIKYCLLYENCSVACSAWQYVSTKCKCDYN